MINQIQNYFDSKLENFNFEFSGVNDVLNKYPEISPCEPHYKFNCMERLGNALIRPLNKVLHACQTSSFKNSKLVKTVLIIAGIFTMFIAIIGIAIRNLGEEVNPNSSLREQALAKLKLIANRDINLVIRYVDGQTMRLHRGMAILESTLLHNSLSPGAQFTDQITSLEESELRRIGYHALNEHYYRVLLPALFDKHTSGQDVSQELGEVHRLRALGIPWKNPAYDQLRKEWESTWPRFQQKLRTNNDTSEEEAALLRLAGYIPGFQSKVSHYIQYITNRVKDNSAIRQLYIDFNQIIQQMT